MALERVGPTPHLDTTVELALDMGVAGKQGTKGVNVGELALPFVCHVAVFPTLAPWYLGQVGELALGS